MGDNLTALAAWAQTHVETTVFYALAFLAIPFAYGVLLDRRIIRSGFLLIGVFGAISGLFLLLQAQFLAMAQMMIYAVGITLVVVIALMLTNPRMEQDVSPTLPIQKTPGVIVAILLFLTIYLSLRSEIWPLNSGPMKADNVMQIGTGLLTYYSLPFEFASVLLLVALIGAVMLARAEKSPASRVEERLDAQEDSSSERKDNVVQV